MAEEESVGGFTSAGLGKSARTLFIEERTINYSVCKKSELFGVHFKWVLRTSSRFNFECGLRMVSSYSLTWNSKRIRGLANASETELCRMTSVGSALNDVRTRRVAEVMQRGKLFGSEFAVFIYDQQHKSNINGTRMITRYRWVLLLFSE